jgi:hypothetical protein
MEYRPGRLNSVIDALSHCNSNTDADAAKLSALSGPSFHLLDVIHAATLTDVETGRLCQQL